MPKKAIEAFCRKHYIRKLSLFGSVLRDDFNLESEKRRVASSFLTDELEMAVHTLLKV